jgi:hypothetical protein
MRILVTGSRDWKNWETIQQAISEVTFDIGFELITVIHGGCPTGADQAADTIGSTAGFAVEIHDAMWQLYGSKAGPMRNQEMVDASADVCLAFVMPCQKSGCRRIKPHDSHGTADCIERARKAGIRTWVYRPDTE